VSIHPDTVEMPVRPVWTAASAGAKPERLDQGVWLVEVVRVIDGTGTGDESLWWCKYPCRLDSDDLNAGVVAQAAAADWYEQTDQSGGSCEVVMRCTTWTGEVWIVDVPVAWRLKTRVRKAMRARTDGGAA
jgi:hypothetical protein